MGDDAAKREARIARERTNSAVVVTPRASRYVLLRAPGDGKLLAAGALALSTVDYASDDAVWESVAGGYKHPVHGTVLEASAVEAATAQQDEFGEKGSPVQLHCEEFGDVAGDSVAANGSCGGFAAATFTALWGPDRLPSEYLSELTDTGLVAMPALLAPDTVAELQQLATHWADPEFEGKPMVLRSPLGVKASTHPVALWVIKSYLKTDGVKLAHTPIFAILPPGGGTNGTQGAKPHRVYSDLAARQPKMGRGRKPPP